VLVTLIAVIDSSDTTESVESGAVRAPRTEQSAVGSTAAPPTSDASNASDASDGDAPASTPTTSKRALAPLPAPTAASPLRLWVGGDSLAAGPSWAVFELAQATGVIKTLAEYQVGTGLNRDEFWDWPKHMDAVVRARDPQVSVFMVGANDDQPITGADGQAYAQPDPKFIEEYRRRVDELMTTLTADGRRLIWIGMPPMRDGEYSSAMGLIDQVMAEEASKHPRVVYVDAWAMFSEPGAVGTYAQSIPDESGQLVDMRLDDGIHLNVAGSQFLARAVMAELGKLVTLPPS